MPCIETVLGVGVVALHQGVHPKVAVRDEHMRAEPPALEMVEGTFEALGFHVVAGLDFC